jgi:hypothetical protein
MLPIGLQSFAPASRAWKRSVVPSVSVRSSISWAAICT